jgi:hypothetical protein
MAKAANRTKDKQGAKDMLDSDRLSCLLLTRLRRVYALAIAAGDLRAALRALNLEAKAQGLYRHAELAAELRAGADVDSHLARLRAGEGQPQETVPAALPLAVDTDQEAA